MAAARLEHANITVTDPKSTALELCRLFDWDIRWEGAAKDNGYTIHVGGPDSYLAVYSKPGTQSATIDTYATRGGLNHLGIIVDDLKDAEARVRTAGYAPHSHADYEPGRRFYFHNSDEIEIEVIAYD